MTTKIILFSCGAQWADWQVTNCDGCKNGFDDKEAFFYCDAHRMLNQAYFYDGKSPKWVADYVGYFDNRGEYIWHCPKQIA